MPTLSALPAHRPLIYGHRGCRGLRPENTIPAFLHALECGVDGLELDVVISADNQVVVSHEPWLNAAICTDPDGRELSPEAGRAFNLFRQPYAAIRRCDCGQRQHPSFPEQVPGPAHKPLLTEVFAAVAAWCAARHKPLPAFSVELKSTPESDGLDHPSPADFIALVNGVLQTSALPATPAEVLLMSFDHRVVQAARRNTGWPVCLLIEDQLPLAHHLSQLGFVPDIVGPHHSLLTADFLTRCTAARLPIVAWTANDVTTMQQLAAQGVRGITTDYPNRAAELFAL